jgi:hypothetical protein
MQLFFILLFLLALNIFIYFILNAKIKKKLDNSSLFTEHQNRLNGLVHVLDETVDENITLIEAKILELKKAIDVANRKITLLEKEAQNYERSKQLYNDLGRSSNKRPTINAVVNIESSTEESGKIINENNIRHSAIRAQQSMQQSPSVTFKEESEQGNFEKEAVALYREGKEAKEIAALLGIPLATVNLVLTMRFNKKN